MAVDIKVMVFWDVMSYSLIDETNILEYFSASNSMIHLEDECSGLLGYDAKPRASCDGIRPNKRKGRGT
jgi:hypothetical protein